jgi:hypothetical protein
MKQVIGLEHALDLGRTHGLADLADELRRELQGIPADALDMKSVFADVEMPAAEAEAFRAVFRKGTWEDAMRRFDSQGPPGGEPGDVEEHVERVMRDYPLQFLFTKVIVGPDRATSIFRATGQASHRRLAISQHRAESARFWGIFAADVLDIVRTHHRVPNHDALTAFFATSLIDVEVADQIARAVELHWSHDHDESVHLLIPRLETVLRELARRVGVPIIREPIGAEPGGVRGLGAIFQDLRGAFRHAGWHAYLENLLTDPLGVNLRNAVAHGLRPRFTKVDSALLIHAACYLRLVGLQEVEAEPPVDPTTPDSGLRIARWGGTPTIPSNCTWSGWLLRLDARARASRPGRSTGVLGGGRCRKPSSSRIGLVVSRVCARPGPPRLAQRTSKTNHNCHD